MKIGQKPELPSAAAQAAGSAKQQARAGASAASALGQSVAKAKAAGAPVSFSPAARGLEPISCSSNSSDFDVDRVNAMRAAIANGTFQFNPQAVADKMLSNAYEVLSHARV
ncbi:flagellar biosynthesis anti-sigma factor FlgM [Simplicispira psychrophila]|uniref:flagellar biosynthesis anti-sigma factor FlgM n=1 Tax=Simplicispira psychrophila TaxID=80882 RepID=UPI00048A2484|nr:flagellar biosynthesis anti-sigma factor FlgM [Simplicispira psychrophila]